MRKAKPKAAPETPPGKEPAPEAEAGEAPAPVDGAAAEETATPPAPEEADPEQTIADLKERLLRSMAETENLRRRAAREREDALKYAVTGFARDLLNVSDNLARALEAAPEEARKDNEALANLAAGIEMTERELMGVFERNGIETIEPLGEMFDHDRHQAMFQVPDSGRPPGTVVQVVQVGYMLKDRLLRPAMVGVAEGQRKPGNGGGSQDDGRDGGKDDAPPPAHAKVDTRA